MRVDSRYLYVSTLHTSSPPPQLYSVSISEPTFRPRHGDVPRDEASMPSLSVALIGRPMSASNTACTYLIALTGLGNYKITMFTRRCRALLSSSLLRRNPNIVRCVAKKECRTIATTGPDSRFAETGTLNTRKITHESIAQHTKTSAQHLQQSRRHFSKETSEFNMTAAKPSEDHFLTLSCPDKAGIVYAVTGLLAEQSLTILDLQQFSDPVSKTFFMRVHFGHATDLSQLHPPLAKLASEMSMDYDVRSVSTRPKVLIMVSKIGHCLNDLLFRVQSGQLKIEVPVIVSNHAEFETLAKSHGIAFHHLPVTKDTKDEQEAKILDLITEHKIELVVLARYMQVLSPKLCEVMSGKIINIHHSFLPSFKGAKPYHQAYDRGVKIIGATAHFVTKDLDEGPIIEQRVARVDHGMNAKELVEEGSNVESQVLAAAVKWWSEKRVFLNGGKTVVFN
jgi:formyltetrahydrofolate deformylase